MKKNALAILLALCMVITMLPATAFAAPAETPAPAAGPEILYRPMSDVAPMSGLQAQPMVDVDGNELIILHTEGGTVSYTTETSYYSARFWAVPDEGWRIDNILIEYTENIYEPEVKYLGFDEFGLHMGGCDVRLTIFFTELSGPTYKVRINADAVGGTYTVNRTSGQAGEYVRIHVVPDKYYCSAGVYGTVKGSSEEIWPHWKGDLVSEPSDYEFVIPEGDLDIVLRFNRYGPYEVKAVPFNAGGTVSIPVEQAYYGEVIPMTVTPDPGYRVLYITFQGLGSDKATASYAGNDIWNVTMGDGWLTIYVSFTENINPVTVTAGEGGTAFADVSEAKEGEPVTLTVTPDENYRVEQITGVEDLVDNGDGTYTFVMPEEAVTISVTFRKIYNPIAVTVENGIGGTASTDPAQAKAGDLVTLSCAPEEGYRVARITGVAEITDNGDNTYTFPMPDEAVELKVLFLRENNPFLDINETHFFHDPVLWAVGGGITNGIDETHFGPFVTTNRAAVVTMLWRYAGSPEPTTTVNPFEDVPDNVWYTKSVLWAVENGITNGISATEFGPNGICNRAQVVTFLYRALKAAVPEGAENPFVDVEAGSWYEAPVMWALANGVTTGADAAHFNPTGECLRAQFVTFLYRADQIPESEPDPLPVPGEGE